MQDQYQLLKIIIYNYNMKKNNVYDNNYTSEIKELRKQFYATQKNNILKFEHSNISTPYSRQFINKPQIDKLNDFYTQFDLPKSIRLQSTKNCKTSKEQFLVDKIFPFSKQRDKIVDDYNASNNLSLFTGINLKSNKCEVENFFQPIESIRLPESRPDIFIDRYKFSAGIMQNDGDRSKIQQVGPGVNIPITQINLNGMKDDTRILPKNIDQLRRANNQKISYTEPVNIGKSGEVCTSYEHIGEVRKYLPDQYKVNSDNDINVGRSQISKVPIISDHILKDTNRINSKQITGNNSMNLGYYNKGLLEETFKQQLSSLPQQSIGSSANKQNTRDTYNIYDNQRSTINIESYGNIGTVNGNLNTQPYQDLAKITNRQEINELDNLGISLNKGLVVNHYNNVKNTNRQDINIEYNGNMSYHNNIYTKQEDELRSTGRQDVNTKHNGNINSQNNIYTKQEDELRSTGRQDVNTKHNGNMSYQNNIYTKQEDELRSTGRQDVNTKHNGNINSQNNIYTKQEDELRSTGRQDILYDYFGNPSGIILNTAPISDILKSTQRQNMVIYNHLGNIIGSVYGNVVKLTDKAKHTIKEDTLIYNYLGNMIGIVNACYISYQDDVKPTLKQYNLLTNHLGTPIGVTLSNTCYYSDNAKATLKQDTLYNHSGNIIGNMKGNIIHLLDNAKATIKQDTLIYDHLGNALGIISGSIVQLSDIAKPTIKQDTMVENYISNSKLSTNIRERSDINNMETSDSREIISKNRTPTAKGILQTPNEKLLNMELKIMPNFESLKNPNKSRITVKRFDYNNIHKKNTLNIDTFFDSELVNIQNNILTNNKLINNIVHKAKDDANIFDNFFYNKS